MNIFNSDAPMPRGGERYVSWWLKWEDLNWPNADNLDRIRRRADLIAARYRDPA